MFLVVCECDGGKFAGEFLEMGESVALAGDVKRFPAVACVAVVFGGCGRPVIPDGVIYAEAFEGEADIAPDRVVIGGDVFEASLGCFAEPFGHLVGGDVEEGW